MCNTACSQGCKLEKRFFKIFKSINSKGVKTLIYTNYNITLSPMYAQVLSKDHNNHISI